MDLRTLASLILFFALATSCSGFSDHGEKDARRASRPPSAQQLPRQVTALRSFGDSFSAHVLCSDDGPVADLSYFSPFEGEVVVFRGHRHSNVLRTDGSMQFLLSASGGQCEDAEVSLYVPSSRAHAFRDSLLPPTFSWMVAARIAAVSPVSVGFGDLCFDEECRQHRPEILLEGTLIAIGDDGFRVPSAMPRHDSSLARTKR